LFTAIHKRCANRKQKFEGVEMSNALDRHVGAYQNDNLYNFDNEILLT
jgi:hypothetical protein